MKPLGKISVCTALAAAAALAFFTARNGGERQPPATAGHPAPRPSHSGDAPRRAASRWQGLADPALSPEARLDLARSIRPGLPAADIDELFSLMSHRPADHDREKWWLIVNEIMEQMRKNGVGADRYTARLSSLIADPAAGEVVRDYAIQHLGQWLAPAVPGSSPGEADETARAAALKTIAAAIKDPSLLRTTVPGTGLLTLADAAERLDEAALRAVHGDLAAFLADTIGGANAAGHPVRASAIQFAARTRQSAFLPAIRKLAAAPGVEASVRLSSIHALGLYADANDRVFLTGLSSSDNPFQYAARAALTRFPGGTNP